MLLQAAYGNQRCILAQIQYQDPTNPTDSTAFVTQLAQFSSLEQLIGIHNDLDKSIEYKKYDYQSLDELINWRLYNRTGAGLMAELGSHQLDACSIFLEKKHPLAVTGIGGTFFYTDGREADDHVFTLFEFPGKGEKDDRLARRHT